CLMWKSMQAVPPSLSVCDQRESMHGRRSGGAPPAAGGLSARPPRRPTRFAVALLEAGSTLSLTRLSFRLGRRSVSGPNPTKSPGTRGDRKREGRAVLRRFLPAKHWDLQPEVDRLTHREVACSNPAAPMKDLQTSAF